MASSLKRVLDVDDSDDYDQIAKQARLESGSKNIDIILSIGVRKGERPEMQDRHSIQRQFECGIDNLERSLLLCLFDGHAGSRASEYCNQHFHKVFSDFCQKYSTANLELLEKNMKKIFIETYKNIDDGFLLEARKVKPAFKDGSTATTLFILNNTIYSANLGDSQAILCRQKSADELIPLQLTADHSLLNPEERSRIQKAGGSVSNGRLLGILEVSRAFGNGQLKAHGLICTPSIKKLTLNDADLFVICGTDGLWKMFKPLEAIKYVHTKYLEKKDKNQNLNEIFDWIADSLSAEAVLRGSGDNVTVFISVFSGNLIK